MAGGKPGDYHLLSKHLAHIQMQLGGGQVYDDGVAESGGAGALRFVLAAIERSIRQGERVREQIDILQEWLEWFGHSQAEQKRWRSLLLLKWGFIWVAVGLFLCVRGLGEEFAGECLTWMTLLMVFSGACLKLGRQRIPVLWGCHDLESARLWVELVFNRGDGPQELSQAVTLRRQSGLDTGVGVSCQIRQMAHGFLRDCYRGWRSQMRDFEDRLPLLELIGIGIPAVLAVWCVFGFGAIVAKG